MEIGDYIRYKEEGVQKIGRIEKISATLADDALIIEVDNGDVITSDDVLKSDKSIIHEIEVGDYVNGKRVIKIWEEPFGEFAGQIFTILEGEAAAPTIRDIKSIVTKEQFEAMQYVVKED